MRGVLLAEDSGYVRKDADVDQWRGGEVMSVDIIENRAEQGTLRTCRLNMAYFRNCGLDFNLEHSIMKVFAGFRDHCQHCVFPELGEVVVHDASIDYLCEVSDNING
ncbi:hypothetical protein TNCV_1810891 [Trichonephila clavipes]|nr:hypothetical protein TNCV_1810891 [Trichonephila clavipes]